MTDSDFFLVDIGANLSHSSFASDLNQVIKEAKEAGIGHIIVTGTDLESIISAQAIVTQFPGYLSLTAGFHPHVASTFDEIALQKIKDISRLPEVVAIGETGLDFNRNYSAPKEQEVAFIEQLELACEVNKPVFLHQ